MISLFTYSSFAFSGGSGTKNSPYLISSCSDLQSIANYTSSYFILVNNIDCRNFNDSGFKTIDQFSGTILGNYYTVYDLHVDGSLFREFSGEMKHIVFSNITIVGENCTGLIGEARNARLDDVVVSGYVSGNDGVGGISGCFNGQLTKSSFRGTVLGVVNVGGLVGSFSGKIYNSSSFSEVNGNNGVGGLVGNSKGTIVKSFSVSNVSGLISVGGLVGKEESGKIEKSFSKSVVKGNNQVGGLVGFQVATISSCFSNSSVEGNMSVGGLVGSQYVLKQFPNLVDCYALGNVKGNHRIGGLIGFQSGITEHCYSLVYLNSSSCLVGKQGGEIVDSFYDEMYCNGTKDYALNDSAMHSLKFKDQFFHWCPLHKSNPEYPRLIWQGCKFSFFSLKWIIISSVVLVILIVLIIVIKHFSY